MAVACCPEDLGRSESIADWLQDNTAFLICNDVYPYPQNPVIKNCDRLRPLPPRALQGGQIIQISVMLTSPLILDLKTVHLTDEQFYQLCVANPEIRVERNSEGGLILMPPVGGYSGNQEIELGAELVLWNRQSQLGKVFIAILNRY